MVVEEVVWMELVRMRGVVVAVLGKVFGKASRRARDSLEMKALAARGMPRAGRREESSVRRAAEENVVAALYVYARWYCASPSGWSATSVA